MVEHSKENSQKTQINAKINDAIQTLKMHYLLRLLNKNAYLAMSSVGAGPK